MNRVFINVPAEYVRKVEYMDKNTGELKTFYSITLPYGCFIHGIDMSNAEFSAPFVNEDPVNRGTFFQVPLLEDRLVRVKAIIRNEAGHPLRTDEGRWEKEIYEVDPKDLMNAIHASLK